MFCGAKYIDGSIDGKKHVFLIGRDNSGRIVKIDPQAPAPYCYLETDTACFEYLNTGSVSYSLLFNYSGDLTDPELYAMLQ
jgi:hypothetical protein